MKNKIAIIIVCVLLAVCIAAGVIQHRGHSREENTADTSSYKNESESAEADSSAVLESTQESEDEKTEPKGTVPEKSTAVKKTETTTAKRESTTEQAKAETTSKAGTTQKQTVSVTFSINCKNAKNYGANVPEYMISPTEYRAEQGETAFGALEALCEKNGLSLEYQSKSYIKAIGGLAEKDCGAASGWMFSINGKRINMPASKYVLQNGDVVEWCYVTSAKD